jgi:hypothetical protein
LLKGLRDDESFLLSGSYLPPGYAELLVAELGGHAPASAGATWVSLVNIAAALNVATRFNLRGAARTPNPSQRCAGEPDVP